MYNVRLLDQRRRRIAVIEAPASWQYTRRPSEATNISVALPRTLVEDALPTGMDVHAFLSPAQVVYAAAAERPQNVPKHKHAQIGRFVEIYRGAQHVVTGRIVKTDIAADIITIEGFTEEVLLETHVTPSQYGRVYDHWDLADVARDMLQGWHVLRIKDATQWDGAIEAVNVDLTTEPGVVMLAKSSGRYVSSGHITVRFTRGDVPGFASWDRIRWASDNGAPVRTTMQYRYGDGSTMSAWSDEVEGALPDEIGVVPGTADAEVIDVRINLYTDDTEAEDAEGNKVGVTPYVFAVELIARTEGMVTEGDIPASAGVTVSGIDADGATSLNVLLQACQQAGWEFWVSDGKLNLAQEMGADRTSSVLLRAGTNISVQTLSTSDDELVNILTAYGPGSGINRLVTIRRHEESIAQYGEHHGIQVFEDVTTLDDLIQAADGYLAEHAAPIPAYQVEVHYPYGTEPEFGCGDYVRVADPRNGIVTRSRIAEEQRDCTTSGLRTTLFLGVPAPSLARQVRPTEPPEPVRPPDKPVISVSPIPGGIRVIDTKAPNIRWNTSEVHVSTTQGFTPSAETLVADGRRVRFDVGGLTPDTRYYVRLIRFDTDGNPSEPSDEMSVVAAKFPQEELPADLFQIKATSDVPPTSGALETLWDQDTTTGAAWGSGPVTIEFEYPMQWFFDMVRLYTTTARAYYVEARTKEGTWTKVSGDHVSVAGGYTVQRFAQNKMVVTDALRITFAGSGPVDLRELKFWTITLADEILAQTLRLTGDMRIETEDGKAVVGPLASGGFGFGAADIEGNRSELTEGRLAFFKANEQEPYFYVKHVEMGVADVGQQVKFGRRFESPPEVLVAVQELSVYDPTVGGLQTWRAFPDHVTAEGFVPRAQLEAQGTSGSVTSTIQGEIAPYGPTEVTIASADAGYPRRYSDGGTTLMEWTGSVDFEGGIFEQTSDKVEVYFYHRKKGDADWILFDHATWRAPNFSWSLSVGDLDGTYEWKARVVYVRTQSYYAARLKVDRWRWTANQTISQDGRVQWIATE